MTMFALVGSFTAVDGGRDELVACLLEAAGLMSAAPGCETYLVSTCPDDDNAVWVNEVWRSEAEHDASLRMAGVAELIGRARPLIAGPPTTVRLHPAGGVGMPAG